MYAINHAATGLLLKRSGQSLPILPLLISTQLIELLWVFFNFMGLEYFSISEGKLHLDYLPYSHSVFSTLLVAILSYVVIRWGFKKRALAMPFALGVCSHLVLDVLFHEKDIQLSPFSAQPVWGLGIIQYPVTNFVLELAYGLFCCWSYKANKSLYTAVVIFNILDLPIMLAEGEILNVFVNYPYLLPTFILFQILITWYFVAKLANPKATEARAEHHATGAQCR